MIIIDHNNRNTMVNIRYVIIDEMYSFLKTKDCIVDKSNVPLIFLREYAKDLVSIYPNAFDTQKLKTLKANNLRKYLTPIFCDFITKGIIVPTSVLIKEPANPPKIIYAPLSYDVHQELQNKLLGRKFEKEKKEKKIIKEPKELKEPKEPKEKKLPSISPPKVIKNESPKRLDAEEIKLNIKKADNDYIINVKKELQLLEKNDYNLKKLEKDIQSDDFINKAIDSHLQALNFKYKSYHKLSEMDWQGTGKGNNDDKGPKPKGPDLNEVILKMQKTVLEKYNYIKDDPNKIAEKRKQLLNILNDPDNGISSIKGSSRESLRISLIKIIYMFIEVPTFFFKGFNNFVLTGPAGSGKTKVAGVIANLMKNLGLLVTTNVIMATKQNLVAEYIGQSAPKTRKLLINGIEGVVFIDEAYTLTPCQKSAAYVDNYSEETVGELINFMDKFMGCIIIIVAGYKDKMNDCFLKFNEGMARRFPKQIELIPYNSNDLFTIFEIFLNDTIDVDKVLTIEQRKYMKGIIMTLNKNDVFNNQAGDMLNLSKIIGEDAILNNKNYNKKMINLSFKKFGLLKEIAIDF